MLPPRRCRPPGAARSGGVRRRRAFWWLAATSSSSPNSASRSHAARLPRTWWRRCTPCSPATSRRSRRSRAASSAANWRSRPSATCACAGAAASVRRSRGLGFPMAPLELEVVARVVPEAVLREMLLEARLFNATCRVAPRLVRPCRPGCSIWRTRLAPSDGGISAAGRAHQQAHASSPAAGHDTCTTPKHHREGVGAFIEKRTALPEGLTRPELMHENQNLFRPLREGFPRRSTASPSETADCPNAPFFTWRHRRATAMIANPFDLPGLPAGAREQLPDREVGRGAAALPCGAARGYVYLPLNTAYHRAAEIEFRRQRRASVVVCSGRNFGWVSKIALQPARGAYSPSTKTAPARCWITPPSGDARAGA